MRLKRFIKNIAKAFELTSPIKEIEVEFGYDEKIIAVKEFRQPMYRG
jgi:hypothetical protein